MSVVTVCRRTMSKPNMWYKLGTVNGGTVGALQRDELAIRMTSDQFVEAKKLAREWTPHGTYTTMAH